jgi:predicted O-methyltransferase YrrM
MDKQTFGSIWNKPSSTFDVANMGTIHPHRSSPDQITVSDKLVQKRVSYEWMLLRAAQLNPKAVLEIGTGKGGGCLFYDALVGYDGLIITINLSDQLDMGDDEEIKSEWHKLIFDSGTPEALQAVKDILGDRKVDFLFIDGDHGFWVNGVHNVEPFRKDFNNYYPLVRSGGMAAFHDCDPGTEIRRTYDAHLGHKESCFSGIFIGAIFKE